MKFESKYKSSHSRKCIWMCRLRNGGHFVQREMGWWKAPNQGCLRQGDFQFQVAWPWWRQLQNQNYKISKHFQLFLAWHVLWATSNLTWDQRWPTFPMQVEMHKIVLGLSKFHPNHKHWNTSMYHEKKATWHHFTCWTTCIKLEVELPNMKKLQIGQDSLYRQMDRVIPTLLNTG